MGDVGSALKNMRKDEQQKMAESFEAAMREMPMVRQAGKAIGIDVKLINDGQHWQFVSDSRVLLNFWPSTNRAMQPGGSFFRTKNWRHALSIAGKINRKK